MAILPLNGVVVLVKRKTRFIALLDEVCTRVVVLIWPFTPAMLKSADGVIARLSVENTVPALMKIFVPALTYTPGWACARDIPTHM